MDRLMKIEEIAYTFACTKKRARRILSELGISPAVNFGIGRAGGYRWSERAVEGALLQLIEINKDTKPQKRRSASKVRLQDMSIDDLYALTQPMQ